MDKNDSNFNFPPYMNYDIGCDPIIGDPNMFNPCMQYEQAYMYYRYMTQQIEYKIKCNGSGEGIRTPDPPGMNRLL